jgi:hypothetical protein
MPRTRKCDHCGSRYTTKSQLSRYCTAACRNTAYRSRKAGAGSPQPAPDTDQGLVERETRVELARLGGTGTPMGAVAVALARRVDGAAGEAGSSVAALARELRMTLGVVAEASKVEADPIDELRQRREERLRGAG